MKKVKKAVPKVSKKVKSTETYSATLVSMGRTYKAFGTSAREAVSKLVPGAVKSKAILTIEVGTKKKERILMPFLSFRLFNASGFMKEIALKSIDTLFGL